MSSFYNINESYLNWQEKNTNKKERKELRCSCISKIITFFLHFFVKKDTLVLNIQNKQTKLFEWENNSLGKSK